MLTEGSGCLGLYWFIFNEGDAGFETNLLNYRQGYPEFCDDYVVGLYLVSTENSELDGDSDKSNPRMSAACLKIACSDSVQVISFSWKRLTVSSCL